MATNETRAERLDTHVLAFAIHPDAEWAYSKFPHPLITADYDAQDRLIQIVAVGRMAVDPLQALRGSIGELLSTTDDAPEVGRDFSRELEPA